MFLYSVRGRGRGRGRGEEGGNIRLPNADGESCDYIFYLVDLSRAVSSNYKRLQFNKYRPVIELIHLFIKGTCDFAMWVFFIIYLFYFFLRYLMEPNASLNKGMANCRVSAAQWYSFGARNPQV